MATSGILYTNYVSYNGGSYTLTTRLKITWTRTSAPVSENASYITVTGVMESNMSSGYVRGYRSQTLTINGQRALYEAYKATGTNYGGGETVFQVTNFKIPHNDDGTKTFTMSYEAYVGSTSANQWINNQPVSITLDSIARASSFTLTSSSIYTTENIGMSISRASTSFTHDISISYGSTSASLGTGIGTSLSVAVPAAIKTAMKNANSASASCTITVTTKNGSTAIGSKTGTISISAPNATISTSVASVAVNSATAQWSLGNTDTGLCTYTVTRSLGSIVYTDQTKTTTTSKNNGANANFLQSTTNAKSGTVTTQVTTFVGSTQVGTNSTTYTVTIPSSYGPSISLASGYPKKYSDTASYQGLYLAGYSGVQWKATGAVGSGSYASISSLTAEIISGYGTLSNSVSGSTITASLSKLTASSSNYTEKVRLTVTDSRGYTAYVDSSVSVSGYYLPVFDMENTWAKRATSSGTLDNEGTYANLSSKATTHSNSYITSLVIKTGSTTIKTVSNTSSSTKTLTATQNAYGTYSTTSEGSFSATATDSMGKTSTVSFILPKAAVHLSLYEGNPGVGIGTIAEANHLVTALPIITTRTDILHYRNTYGAFNLLFTKDGPDQYGIGVGLGAGGTTVVGAGESASACLNDISSAGDENLWLAADGTIYLCPNSQTWSSRKTLSITYDGRILIPSTQFKITSESAVTEIIISDVTYSEVVAQDSSLSSSRDDDRWFSALIKALCAKYPNRSSIRFIGQTSPNSLRNYEITIYNTSDLKSGLPRYSYGLTHNYGGSLDRFGTEEYSYYRNAGVYYAASAGSATSATSATNATNATNIKIASGTNDKRYLVGVTNYSSTNQAPYISAENKCYMQSGYLYSNGIIVNSVTTATGVVTRTSGCTLKSSTINIAGKVAQLNVVLTGPSGSQTDGTKIFVGTISNTAYRPKASARGCDTYGTSALIGWITTGGEVNIRVMDAGTYDTELEMAFTYIIP